MDDGPSFLPHSTDEEKWQVRPKRLSEVKEYDHPNFQILHDDTLNLPST